MNKEEAHSDMLNAASSVYGEESSHLRMSEGASHATNRSQCRFGTLGNPSETRSKVKASLISEESLDKRLEVTANTTVATSDALTRHFSAADSEKGKTDSEFLSLDTTIYDRSARDSPTRSSSRVSETTGSEGVPSCYGFQEEVSNPSPIASFANSVYIDCRNAGMAFTPRNNKTISEQADATENFVPSNRNQHSSTPQTTPLSSKSTFHTFVSANTSRQTAMQFLTATDEIQQRKNTLISSHREGTLSLCANEITKGGSMEFRSPEDMLSSSPIQTGNRLCVESRQSMPDDGFSFSPRRCESSTHLQNQRQESALSCGTSTLLNSILLQGIEGRAHPQRERTFPFSLATSAPMDVVSSLRKDVDSSAYVSSYTGIEYRVPGSSDRMQRALGARNQGQNGMSHSSSHSVLATPNPSISSYTSSPQSRRGNRDSSQRLERVNTVGIQELAGPSDNGRASDCFVGHDKAHGSPSPDVVEASNVSSSRAVAGSVCCETSYSPPPNWVNYKHPLDLGNEISCSRPYMYEWQPSSSTSDHCGSSYQADNCTGSYSDAAAQMLQQSCMQPLCKQNGCEECCNAVTQHMEYPVARAISVHDSSGASNQLACSNGWQRGECGAAKSRPRCSYDADEREDGQMVVRGDHLVVLPSAPERTNPLVDEYYTASIAASCQRPVQTATYELSNGNQVSRAAVERHVSLPRSLCYRPATVASIHENRYAHHPCGEAVTSSPHDIEAPMELLSCQQYYLRDPTGSDAIVPTRSISYVYTPTYTHRVAIPSGTTHAPADELLAPSYLGYHSNYQIDSGPPTHVHQTQRMPRLNENLTATSVQDSYSAQAPSQSVEHALRHHLAVQEEYLEKFASLLKQITNLLEQIRLQRIDIN